MSIQIEKLAAAISAAEHIAVLSGAGISTASGIPDFRSADGIYSKISNVEYLLSEEYYAKQPKDFWLNFKHIFQLQNMHSYKPNPAHIMLAELEQLGKKVSIITQNVDGLHRQAGSSTVYEAHGSIDLAHCPKCGSTYPLEYVMQQPVPRCQHDQFILKPDVVLFGGRVKYLEEAYKAASNCDLFLTLGSSLEVYPVKELPVYAVRAKAESRAANVTAIVNLQPTSMDHLFDIVLHEELVFVFTELRKLLS